MLEGSPRGVAIHALGPEPLAHGAWPGSGSVARTHARTRVSGRSWKARRQGDGEGRGRRGMAWHGMAYISGELRYSGSSCAEARWLSGVAVAVARGRRANIPAAARVARLAGDGALAARGCRQHDLRMILLRAQARGAMRRAAMMMQGRAVLAGACTIRWRGIIKSWEARRAAGGTATANVGHGARSEIRVGLDAAATSAWIVM